MKKLGWSVLTGALLVIATSLLVAGNATNKESSKPIDKVGAAMTPEGKADLKWARGVAMDFLEAESNRSGSSCGLLSPELFRAVRDAAIQNKSSYLSTGFTNVDFKATITSEEVSPNGHEVIFAGILKDNGTDFPDVDFRLRVVRESAQGKWMIRFIKATERKK